MTDSSEDEYDKGDDEQEEEQLDDEREDDVEEGCVHKEMNKPPKPPNSFWGKNISKTTTLDHFIKKNK